MKKKLGLIILLTVLFTLCFGTITAFAVPVTNETELNAAIAAQQDIEIVGSISVNSPVIINYSATITGTNNAQLTYTGSSATNIFFNILTATPPNITVSVSDVAFDGANNSGYVLNVTEATANLNRLIIMNGNLGLTMRDAVVTANSVRTSGSAYTGAYIAGTSTFTIDSETRFAESNQVSRANSESATAIFNPIGHPYTMRSETVNYGGVPMYVDIFTRQIINPQTGEASWIDRFVEWFEGIL